MGRLIPAGTGYRFYSDVEIIEGKEEEAGEEIDVTPSS
jgi:hypothetical protein